MVTTTVGYRYYLKTSNAAKPAPKLRAVKTPRYPGQVARWQTSLGRDSFVAWLCADLGLADHQHAQFPDGLRV